MMRYSLNSTDKNGLTLVEKEIEYIQNFIEILSLRFGDEFNVKFEIEGVLTNKKMVPLLLITFVENAFKHGKINDAQKPITIKINITEVFLTLYIENQKQRGTKDETSGIGLENTRKRLEMVYPKRHELQILDDANYFIVNLKILFA
jgi:two-component system, LytTR family, sensor kinase